MLQLTRAARVWLPVVVLFLMGCSLPGSPADFRPTIGPVQDGSGGPGGPGSSLVASSNCVEVGEPLTLTATFKNWSDAPLTLQGEPPLDIVIRPSFWQESPPEPVARWSESDQYPRDFNPTFQPGETRTYTWTWTVDRTFTQRPLYQGNLIIQLVRGVSLEAGGTGAAGEVGTVYVGLGVLEYGGQGSRPCAELRR